MSNAHRKILVPELQRALAVENIAAKFKVTNEQEFSLTKTYEGPPFSNNEFAMALYEKVYAKSKSKDKNSAVTAILSICECCNDRQLVLSSIISRKA